MRWVKTFWPKLGQQKRDSAVIAAQILDRTTHDAQYRAPTLLAAAPDGAVADDIKRRQIALAVRYVATLRLR
jgi:hypothetical protein